MTFSEVGHSSILTFHAVYHFYSSQKYSVTLKNIQRSQYI